MVRRRKGDRGVCSTRGCLLPAPTVCVGSYVTALPVWRRCAQKNAPTEMDLVPGSLVFAPVAPTEGEGLGSEPRAFARTNESIDRRTNFTDPSDGGGPDVLSPLQAPPIACKLWPHPQGVRAVAHSFFFKRSRTAPRGCALGAGRGAKEARANAAPNWLPCPPAAARPLPGPSRQRPTRSIRPHPSAPPCGGGWPQCRPNEPPCAQRCPPPTPLTCPDRPRACSAARTSSLDGGALWFAVLSRPEVAPTTRLGSHRRARRPRPRPRPTPAR